LILHQERVNKVFGKRSTQQLDRFFKFVIMTHLPLRQVYAGHHRLQRAIIQTEWRLFNSIIIEEEEPSYILFSLIMSYMLSLVICIGMILLDNML
jgi:hypothetical protein